MSRFFIDHGAIHDRVTGKHVAMVHTEEDWQEHLLSLLNELDRKGRECDAEMQRLLAAPQPATQPVAWILEHKGGGQRVLQWPEDIAPGRNKATRARMEETGWKYYPLVLASPPAQEAAPFVCSKFHREVTYYGEGCPMCELQEHIYCLEHPAEPASLGAATRECECPYSPPCKVGDICRKHHPIKAGAGKWHYTGSDYSGPWFSEEFPTEAACREAAQKFANENGDSLDILQFVGDEVVAAAPGAEGEKS